MTLELYAFAHEAIIQMQAVGGMSGSGTAFSSDGVEAISKQIESSSLLDAGGKRDEERDIKTYYEMERCSAFIATNNFRNIALQFPDFLLPDSTHVAMMLQREFPDREFYILGDTSYGSCCVDEVAAEHVMADSIIHFGPSCLTQTKRLPVLYVFGREYVDTVHCLETFRSLFPTKEDLILVLYDTVFSHCIDEVKGQLVQYYPNCVVSSLLLPNPVQSRSHDHIQSKSHDLSEAASVQSNIEATAQLKELCCSSCSKTGAGRCGGTEKKIAEGDSEQTKREKAIDLSEHSEGGGLDTGAENGQETAESVEQLSSSRNEVNADSERAERKQEVGGGGVALEGESDLIRPSITPDLHELPSGEAPVKDRKLPPDDVTSGGVGAGSDKDKITSEVPVYKYDRYGRSFTLTTPIEDYKVFYMGVEGRCLSNLMLNFNKCQFYSYNPLSRESRRETTITNKALGRRYFLVQKAKEAKTVGILVGTLGAGDYLDVIERLKRVIKEAGKKYYTVAIGKLNVPKMANFLEIDVYVLVACPENSLIDSRDFYKPVITPFEMELACIRSREWSGDFTTSFQDLLPGGNFHVQIPGPDADQDVEPEYSLITGGLVPSKEVSLGAHTPSTAVAERSKMEVAIDSSTGAQFLQGRSWKGLEQRLGETTITDQPRQGRSGLPVSYSHEHEHGRQTSSEK